MLIALQDKFLKGLIGVVFLVFAVLFLIFPHNANAELSVTTNSFRAKTTTGSQAVTGLGFRPKALIFFYSQQTTVGTVSPAAASGVWLSYGVGIAASSTQGPVGGASVSATETSLTTSDSGVITSSTKEIILLQSATVLGASADVTSFDADGFTLNWIKATTTPFIIHYYAVGGSDIANATSGVFTLSTGTGASSTTGVGFKPDFLFFLTGSSTLNGAPAAAAKMGIGLAASSTAGSIEQAGWSLLEQDAQGTSITCSDQVSTSSIVITGPTCDLRDALATVSSFDADGFTINKSNGPAVNTPVFYLALKGGDHSVGNFTKPTGIGFSTTTKEGHTPQGLFLTSFNQAASGITVPDASFSIGAATSSIRGESLSYSDDDADTSLDVDMRTTASSTATSTNMLVNNGVLAGEARLDLFQDDGFTMYWSTADATARQLLYWTVAPNKVLTVSATGTQVTTLSAGGTSQYVGGAFKLSTNTSSTEISQIIVTETNSVNANTGLSNLQLLYESDATGACIFDGNETSFGTSSTFNGSEKATVTGSFAPGTTNICVYPRVDVSGGATGDVDLEISNPAADITVSSGATTTPATAIAITGASTISAATISVSGSCDQFDQVTNCADAETVRVAVNGNLQAQTGTTSGGTWTISGVSEPGASGDVITVFVTSTTATVRAAAVTKWVSGNVTGMTLVERHLTLGSADNQTISNANLSQYDNSVAGDANVFWEVDASSDLKVDTGNIFSDEKLLIRAGNTYQPDSTGAARSITTQHFQASSTAVVVANGSVWRLGGDFVNNGTFTAGTSTVEFSGATSTIDNATSTFYNLTASSTATVTASSSITVSNILQAVGTLSINSARIVTASATTTLSGTISGAGLIIFPATSTGPGASGTLSSLVRFDASAADAASTNFPARTYGGLVEVYASSATARVVNMASGNYVFDAGLNIFSGGTASTTLQATTTNPSVAITGDLDFTGTGTSVETIRSGTGTWSVTGNVNFTDGNYIATVGNTLRLIGSAVGTLTVTTSTLHNLEVSASAAKTFAANATTTVAGNFTIIGTSTAPVFTNTTILMTSTSAAFAGGGMTLNNLTIDPTSAGTITAQTSDSFIGNVLAIASGDTLSISSGITATVSSTLTLTGTISGAGRLTYRSGTAFPTTGTISSILRFDASSSSQTMSNRIYGGLVEIDNSGSTAGRTVTMSAGTHTLSAGLDVKESGSGDVDLTGSSNAPTVDITGNLTCSVGAGNTITTGSGNWSVSGNVDLSNCTLAASVGNTLIMGGTGTLTSNAQTLRNFTASGTVTLADATHTVAGNLSFAGGTITPGASTVVMTSSTASITGGGATLNSLTASSTGTITLQTSGLTVSSTLTIATTTNFSISSGVTSTITTALVLNGTSSGAGRLVYRGSATFPTNGTVSSILRFDTTNNNQSIPARTYGGAVEVDNSGSTAGRTATLGTAAAQTVTFGTLTLLSSGSGGVAITGSANNPNVVVSSFSITSGGGAKDITTGSGTWTASGNFNLTNIGTYTASAGTTLAFNGSSQTFTPVSLSFGNLDFSGATTPTISGNATSSGNITLVASMTLTGVALRMTSTTANLVGASNTLPTLIIDPLSAGTITVTGSDITVSNTLDVASDDTLSIASGRMLSHTGTTLTLNGTISGAGTLRMTDTSSGPDIFGTLSSIVRYDASAATVPADTFDARSYGGLVEAYASSATARILIMGSGTFTLSGGLNVLADGSNSTTLDASSSDPIVSINNGGIDFTGTGSGSEIIQAGSDGWIVTGGDVNFTGGTYSPETAGTLTLTGSGQTLTSAANSYSNLTLTPSGSTLTLADSFTVNGDLTLGGAGSVSAGATTVTMGGSANQTLVGGGETLANLTINPTSAATTTLSTSDLTVSGTLDIASGDTLSIGSGRALTHSGATLTLSGNIIGAGTYIYQSSSAFPSTGVITSILRLDATNNAQSIPARTYGGQVEVANTGGTNRTVTMAAGAYTFSSNLYLFASSTGNITLDGSTNAATGTIASSIDYLGGGAGIETITFSSAPWTISGGLNISAGSFTAPAGTLNLAGDYTNTGGTFTHNSGTVVLNGSLQQTLAGTMDGSSAFNDLTVTNNSGSDPDTTPSVVFSASSTAATFTAVTASTKMRFNSSSTYTFTNINWNGQSTGTRVALRSSTATTTNWFLNVSLSGTQTVSNVDAKDSDASFGEEISAADGSNLNSGGNTNWVFSITAPNATSTANDVFEINAATTTISDFNIRSGGGSPGGRITSSSDIRVRIPAGLSAVWNSASTTITCVAGDACAKISTTGVTYESSNKIAVINVVQNFVNGEWVRISGLQMGNFSAVTNPFSSISLRVDGVADAIDDATDTRTKVIKGKMTYQSHTEQQVGNQFDIEGTSLADTVIFRFQLLPVGENATMFLPSVVTIQSVGGLAAENITDTKLFQDLNNNGAFDTGEPQLGANGTTTIANASGTIVFGGSWTATTTTDVILRADIDSIGGGDNLRLTLSASNLGAQGATTLQALTINGSSASINHGKPQRFFGGGGAAEGGTPGGPGAGGAPPGSGGSGGEGGNQGGNGAGGAPPGGGGGGEAP